MVLIEAGAFGEQTLVRTGEEIELVGARVLDTAGNAPVSLSPFYDGDMFIYENQAALPRGICVARSLFGGFDRSGGDPGMLEIAKSVTGLASHISGRTSVRFRGAGLVEADVSAEEASVLLLQDTWYPGWRATVDGVETPLLQTDLGIRALPVEQGEHEVIMEYEPGSFRLGLGLSLLGILLGVLYGAKTKRR